MYWSGVSTLIKNGEIIKSNSFEYKILALINDGASLVYKAKRDDGIEVFLKQFRNPTRTQNGFSDFIDFHYKVFHKLKELGNIVENNYEYFEYKNSHFQAKELLKGNDLEKIIWKEKPSFIDRFHIAIMILGILKVMHSKGIIHSDLKPQQIFITKDENLIYKYRVKFIDFDHCIIPKLSLSRPAGTSEWKSPEHVNNKTISYHSDVYTIGAIIYTLLTGGKQPYSHSIKNDTYDTDILSKKGYHSLMEVYHGKFFQDISDMVDRMLDPDPIKRPTAKEVHSLFVKSLKPSKESSTLKLSCNGKEIVISENTIITRELCKNSFGIYEGIYNKQFELFKDNNDKWFIKGFETPDKARDISGNELNFYSTYLDNKDITNIFTLLSNSSIIKVGNIKFEITI